MENTLTVELVTPEKLEYSAPAKAVQIPGKEGDFGVLPRHAPFVSLIRPGIVEITPESGETRKVFVVGGVAEVIPERCTILAIETIEMAHITRKEAEERLRKASKLLESAANPAQKREAEEAMAVAEALTRLAA